MEKYFAVLQQCPLFSGICEADLNAMLGCLDGKIEKVGKGQPVFFEGDPARYFGVVLSGSVRVVRDDYYGNRSVLTEAEAGGLFGEAFACAELELLPVSVFAVQSSTVLLLDRNRVLNGCSNACHFHNRLIHNLLQGIAQKNLLLTQKIRYMSQKTTREKLMEFLLDQAKSHGSAEFTIAYDRQALADFLGVERSAMSAELSKMRRAGILESTGSRFRLLMGRGNITK